MIAILVVASVLGAARVTHFIADDSMLTRFRLWISTKSKWLFTGITCTYCVGVWVAGVCTLWLWWRIPGVNWDIWLAVFPAIAYAIVLLEALADFLWKDS